LHAQDVFCIYSTQKEPLKIAALLFSTQILQLAAKSARRADESPFWGFVGVNPDLNATHLASILLMQNPGSINYTKITAMRVRFCASFWYKKSSLFTGCPLLSV
jgi:hypothetical protein